MQKLLLVGNFCTQIIHFTRYHAIKNGKFFASDICLVVCYHLSACFIDWSFISRALAFFDLVFTSLSPLNHVVKSITPKNLIEPVVNLGCILRPHTNPSILFMVHVTVLFLSVLQHVSEILRWICQQFIPKFPNFFPSAWISSFLHRFCIGMIWSFTFLSR